MPVSVGMSSCYATSPYRGAGDIDMAEVEQHVLFELSFRCTGILHDPLLDRVAGGCISFVRITEFERDSIWVAYSAAGEGESIITSSSLSSKSMISSASSSII